MEGLKDAEEAPDCEHCTDNRLLLEHAWQVVANEFYDPAGRFSQAKWADQLLTTFKVGHMLQNPLSLACIMIHHIMYHHDGFCMARCS